MEESFSKITMGVSSCLLGNEVRFDGGHKRDRYITDTLSNYFEYVPVCAEVECGMSVPRESMKLTGTIDAPILTANKSGRDLTAQMATWAQKRMKELEADDLNGFIFKSKSPSCGMERVKVYDHNNIPQANGVGIFANIFKKHFPLLPIEEEGRLHDPKLRENFIESVFVYRRWRDVLKTGTAGALVQFHTRHKFLLHVHNEPLYREMGLLTASAGQEGLKERLEEYQQLLMKAMQIKPTIKTHVNVLMHLMGYFKKNLSADEKKELLEVIEQFKKALIPLVVPITLLNHYVRKYQESYLEQQYYLNPHPTELKLRNHS